MNCENCGKETTQKLCLTCFEKAMHELFDEDGCHNCDNKCLGCEPYHFEDDETKVYNDLNETE